MSESLASVRSLSRDTLSLINAEPDILQFLPQDNDNKWRSKLAQSLPREVVTKSEEEEPGRRRKVEIRRPNGIGVEWKDLKEVLMGIYFLEKEQPGGGSSSSRITIGPSISERILQGGSKGMLGLKLELERFSVVVGSGGFFPEESNSGMGVREGEVDVDTWDEACGWITEYRKVVMELRRQAKGTTFITPSEPSAAASFQLSSPSSQCVPPQPASQFQSRPETNPHALTSALSAADTPSSQSLSRSKTGPLRRSKSRVVSRQEPTSRQSPNGLIKIEDVDADVVEAGASSSTTSPPAVDDESRDNSRIEGPQTGKAEEVAEVGVERKKNKGKGKERDDGNDNTQKAIWNPLFLRSRRVLIPWEDEQSSRSSTASTMNPPSEAVAVTKMNSSGQDTKSGKKEARNSDSNYTQNNSTSGIATSTGVGNGTNGIDRDRNDDNLGHGLEDLGALVGDDDNDIVMEDVKKEANDDGSVLNQALKNDGITKSGRPIRKNPIPHEPPCQSSLGAVPLRSQPTRLRIPNRKKLSTSQQRQQSSESHFTLTSLSATPTTENEMEEEKPAIFPPTTNTATSAPSRLEHGTKRKSKGSCQNDRGRTVIEILSSEEEIEENNGGNFLANARETNRSKSGSKRKRLKYHQVNDDVAPLSAVSNEQVDPQFSLPPEKVKESEPLPTPSSSFASEGGRVLRRRSSSRRKTRRTDISSSSSSEFSDLAVDDEDYHGVREVRKDVKRIRRSTTTPSSSSSRLQSARHSLDQNSSGQNLNTNGDVQDPAEGRRPSIVPRSLNVSSSSDFPLTTWDYLALSQRPPKLSDFRDFLTNLTNRPSINPKTQQSWPEWMSTEIGPRMFNRERRRGLDNMRTFFPMPSELLPPTTKKGRKPKEQVVAVNGELNWIPKHPGDHFVFFSYWAIDDLEHVHKQKDFNLLVNRKSRHWEYCGRYRVVNFGRFGKDEFEEVLDEKSQKQWVDHYYSKAKGGQQQHSKNAKKYLLKDGIILNEKETTSKENLWAALREGRTRLRFAICVCVGWDQEFLEWLRCLKVLKGKGDGAKDDDEEARKMRWPERYYNIVTS